MTYYVRIFYVRANNSSLNIRRVSTATSKGVTIQFTRTHEITLLDRYQRFQIVMTHAYLNKQEAFCIKTWTCIIYWIKAIKIRLQKRRCYHTSRPYSCDYSTCVSRRHYKQLCLSLSVSDCYTKTDFSTKMIKKQPPHIHKEQR